MQTVVVGVRSWRKTDGSQQDEQTGLVIMQFIRDVSQSKLCIPSSNSGFWPLYDRVPLPFRAVRHFWNSDQAQSCSIHCLMSKPRVGKVIQGWIISLVGVARSVSNIQPIWLFRPAWSANFLTLSRWDCGNELKWRLRKSRMRTQELQTFRFNLWTSQELVPFLLCEQMATICSAVPRNTLEQHTLVKWIALHSSWQTMSHPNALLTVKVVWFGSK